MFLLTKSVRSRMLPFVTASPMCCESRIAMSKSVLCAANWVNIASCQFAFGTVLTLMVAFGRSFLYSAFAKASSALAGGQSNQMKLRVSGSLVSSGMVAGALGALAFAPSSSPPPQAATVVATSSMAAVASRTFRPGTDVRPVRFGCRIFLPAFWWWGLLEPRYALRRAVAELFRRVAGPPRGRPADRRHVIEVERWRAVPRWCRMASIRRFSYTIRWGRQHPAAL